MKINGPGQPPVPGQAPDDPALRPGEAAGAARPGAGGAAGEKLVRRPETSFAETVSGAAPARAPTAADAPGGVAVHDLAAALRAGRLDARTAVDEVIERVLGAQLGPGTPAHVRDKVQAALRDALEDDPVLAEKLRSL